jgi:hypothetical protein
MKIAFGLAEREAQAAWFADGRVRPVFSLLQGSLPIAGFAVGRSKSHTRARDRINFMGTPVGSDALKPANNASVSG